MNNSLSLPSKGVSLEIASRLFWAGLTTFFAVKMYQPFIANPSINLLLLLVSEGLIIGLLLFGRIPVKTNYRPYAFFLTTAATFYFFFIAVSTDQSVNLVSPFAAGIIQLTGIIWQIISKAFLGRSFGLLPAQRGLVTNGPYRLVRHPIYFGYFITHIGVLLSFFSLWNLAIYCMLYVVQILRMGEEEKILKNDPAYETFMKKTPYRFIPFVY